MFRLIFSCFQFLPPFYVNKLNWMSSSLKKSCFLYGQFKNSCRFSFANKCNLRAPTKLDRCHLYLAWFWSTLSSRIAINDVQIWILTAFSLVPTKDLIRKCVLIYLKNTSIFQRSLYSSATVSALQCVLLVRNTSVFWVTGSWKVTRRNVYGWSLLALYPASFMCSSLINPLDRLHSFVCVTC